MDGQLPPSHSCRDSCRWPKGSAQFWLVLILALVGGITAYLRLQFEVEQLREWQQRKESDAFMASDWKAEKALLEKALQSERIYAEELCRNLKRLEIDLGRTPANDCHRK